MNNLLLVEFSGSSGSWLYGMKIVCELVVWNVGRKKVRHFYEATFIDLKHVLFMVVSM